MKTLNFFSSLKSFIAACIVILIFFPTHILAEGSKEIYVGNDVCRLFLHSYFTPNDNLINFAVYDCLDSERLKIDVNSVDEIIYLGFNGQTYPDRHIVYRIKDLDGTIVKPQKPVATAGIGFINSIDEARAGPIALGNPAGYNAEVWTPPDVGTYYIEFQLVLNSSGNPVLGGFYIYLFDITVANSITNTAIPGRLYSQGWQFDGIHCSPKLFIYSSDSIITSLELNNMNGAYWYLFCNQTGVGTTGNIYEDRKSVPNDNVFLPEYNIFLNDPDSILFPPATSLGHIYGDIIGQPYCDGTIDFTVNVDKSGSVQIELAFDPPFVTRVLLENVNVGTNIISWDGYDGTQPDSLPVPNGTNVTYSISYINGLTHLPLCDVFKNDSGLVIELVNPAGSSPLVFWDDSNIPGGTTNFTGCSSTSNPWSGCHSWTYGSDQTMNTWWYNVSTTSAPVTVVSQRDPDTLVFDQAPQNYCADTMGIPISVAIDPNTSTYTWGFTGNDGPITQLLPSDNFITIDFGPLATSGDIFVYGTNDSCGSGDTSFLFIEIQELPYVSAGLDETIYDNQTITLAGDTLHSTAALWTTSGDGVFSDATILTPVYTPGITDIANGSVELMLEANAVAPCIDPIQDTMVLTILPPPSADDFITTWQTTSPNESITIPTTGGGYNYDVDWGDGNITTNNTGDATHNYVTSGTYTVTISVDFPRIYFNNTGDRNKIMSIEQWGTGSWTSMANAFFGCTNLIENATDVPDLSSVIDMTGMLRSASSFNGNLSNWDVSSIIDMPGTFEDAASFNSDISNWDVSNVTNMSAMFRNATSVAADISNWNVGNVMDMSYMFDGISSFNGDLSTWDVSGVYFMHSMFKGCNSFNSDLSNWDVSIVENMWDMFNNATSFDQNIGNWNVQNVLDMTDMFFGVTLSTSNYDALLIGWDAQNLQSGVNFHGGNSLYCAVESARTNMINNDGWTITDGGKDPVCTEGNQGNFWYFGEYAGLDFNSGGPVALTNSAMSTAEGCSTISDNNGNFLFYTNGITIWNQNHQVMDNGTGLHGSNSASQSSIIVSKPNSDSLYYVFTVPAEAQNGGNMYYSIVDMSLNSGLGKVIDKNIYLHAPVTEKLTGVAHSNGLDIWVVTHEYETNAFCSFLVTTSGVNPTPVVSNVGVVHSAPAINTQGCMKVSRNGSYISCAIEELSLFELFNFNNASGQVSNPITFSNFNNPYGIEYSPDGSMVYIADREDIIQVDLTAGTPDEILNSAVAVDGPTNSGMGTLQIGPDERIYHAHFNGDYLGVIRDPNVLGVGCNYFEEGVYLLGRLSKFGLPAFVQSYISSNILYQNDCYGDTTYFDLTAPDPVQSVLWDFGDPASGSNNTSTELTPGHVFTSPGSYTVTANVIYTTGSSVTFTTGITIFNTPQINLGNDTTLCNIDTIVLSPGAGFTSYLWQDDSINDTLIVSQAGTYWVSVSNYNGCTDIDSINVYYSPLIDIDLGIDSLYCHKDSIILQAGGQYENYLWQDNSTDSNLTVYNDGTYWVGVVNSYECTGGDTVNISFFRNKVNLGNDTTLCSGGTYVLDAGSGFNNFLWNTGQTSQTIEVSVDGVYSVEASYNFCSSNDTIVVQFNTLASSYGGSDDSTCRNIPYDFSGSSSLPSAAGYDSLKWFGGNGYFNNYNILLPVYYPVDSDIGDVELFLVAYSPGDCPNDTSSMILTINEIPTADFIAPSTTLCEYNTILFQDNSTTNIVSWYWDFGDGLTSNTGPSVLHTYATANDYTVNLTVTNINGCLDDTSSNVTISEIPLPAFNYVPNDSICINEVINFTGVNNNTTTITNWDWDMGDGNISTIQNPLHSFATNGIFNVQLMLTNAQGCVNSVMQQITVNQLPDARITVGPDDTICAQLQLSFSGFDDNGTTITDWDWDFGDGNIASGQNVVHTYLAAGTYTVTLYLTNNNSCLDTITSSVLIRALPQSDFTIAPNDTTCVGEEITLDASNITGDIISWNWQFGDGNTATGQNVTHTYNSQNTYNILSIYTNGFGCLDTTIYQRRVENVQIAIDASPDPSCQNFLVSLDGIDFNSNATFTDWVWDYGDMTGGAIGQNTSHIYTQAGTFNITLDVCSQHAEEQIIINATCQVDAGSDEATCEDVSFDLATSADPPYANNVSSVYWYSHNGLGSFDNANSVAPIYFPDVNAGSTQRDTVYLYMVGLGIFPCENDTSFMMLEIVPGAYAFAGSDENTCVNTPFDFTTAMDTAFGTNYDTLYWSGGTGYFINPNVHQPIYVPGPGELGPVVLTMVAASNLVNCDSIDDMVLTIRPEYAMPFDTTVCFFDSVFAQGAWRFASGTFYDTLLSQYSCDSVIITNLTVRPKIDKDFTISTGDSICLGETSQFTQTGTATLTSWLWDFGDGSTSTDVNPIYTYPASGVYDVQLSYTDINGCYDSVIHQVQVFGLPTVSFTASDYMACVDANIDFFGSSTSNIVSWDWDFGDGNTGTGQNTSHSYASFGNFPVTLSVLDINGCSNAALDTITVVEATDVDFSWTFSCDTVTFTDLSIPPPGYYIVQWHWDFGDGTIVTDTTWNQPQHIYGTGGLFDVTLTVVAQSGTMQCDNSITIPVNVPYDPTIYLIWYPQPTCLGDSTQFLGTSGNPISSWFWDFGDGNNSTLQGPSHLYDAIGDYEVTLYILDTTGCSSQLSDSVSIVDVPSASFSFPSEYACVDVPVPFTATTTAGQPSWLWDFGDGNFSTLQNPTHAYTSAGNFFISLTVTDTTACSFTTLEQMITINLAPEADFVATQLVCNSFAFVYTGDNGQAPTSFFWDFDDGGTSTLEDPTHAFPAGGLYNVKLVVSAAVSGQPSCADSITIGVVVPDGPNVGFNWNPEPTNYGDVTDFFGTSSKPIATWAWDFDDSGANSNLQYPSHTFSVPGIFDVLLTATDNEGCVGTSLHQVTVVDNPDVDFTFSPDPGCIDDEITFTGISAASIVSWDWDFGDGYILIGGNQIQGHTYNATGVYTVTLTVTDIYTGVNSVSKVVQVKPLPVANFSYEQPLCALFEVQFHDNSQTPVGYLTEWLWDFGDGNTTTVSYPNNPDVLHAYALPGTYDVTLVVMNSNSCIDDVVNQIVIIPSPTAAFSFSEGCLGQAIAFTDQSVTNGGNIISWAWNFGDPNSGSSNTSTANNPSHVFSASGDFDVTLIIADINGCGDTLIQTITIADPPGVDFSFTTACLGLATQFTVDQTVTNVGEVQTFAWDFGDGNTSSSQDPEHTYAVLGTYQVTLTITTTAGCVNSITHAVQINPLPNANFEHDGPKCLGEPIAFTNLSSSPNGAIDTWVWDFGDGNTITITAPDNPNVEHTYANDVTYDVSLTVTDVEGCEQTVIKQVQVVASPIANFTFEETCFNEPVFFTDLSSTNGGADLGSWEWFFGDPNSGTNNNSTLQNPTHVFSEPGTFTVTLIVNSTLGCSDTIAQDVLVDPLPEVDFTMASDTICLGELAVFTGIGTDINTWFWQFGDGGTSIEQNPTYMYMAPGAYMVMLTVTGIDGCQNSVSYPIFVNQAPVGNFSHSGSCLGDSTYFSDLSVSENGYLVSWEWDFGDGGTAAIEDPSHLYANNDSYLVILIVTDNFGCSDTVQRWVNIFSLPTASFSFEQACEPVGIVYFFDASSPGEEGSPLVEYRWDFVDGYYSTEVNPNYIFPETDTCYLVSLTVTDANGCAGVDTTEVCLFGELSVDFTATTVCLGQPTFFDASYTPASDSVAAYTWKFNDGSPQFVSFHDTTSHIFPNPGSYMVELSALDTNGCSFSIFKEVMVDSLPTPSFTYSAASCDQPTLFTDTSLGGGEFVEFWLWDFGDIASGADNFSTLQHPAHVYAAQDSVYFVKLIVTNFNGCTDSVVQEVNTNPCLTAYFGFCNGLKCARYEVCFTDSSELISNNGNIIEWSWNFGDGNTLTYNAYQNKVCHIYETTGIFPIQLVITAKVNGQLFYDTATSYFTSYPSPETSFETDSVCFNDTTFFTDVSRDNGEPISSWKWDFGQSGLSDTSDLQNPDWLYPETGLYEVQLITINDYGCSDTTQQNVRIYELPQAGFSFEENCASYLTYFNSSESVVEGDGTISSWQWYFGDPNSVDSVAFWQDVTHIYNEAGTYSVRLIVQDENTCLDTVSANVEIFEIPTAGYILTDDFEGRQGNISLENISVGAQQYYWDFDNGDFSDEKNVVYQYREDGNYVIMLVAYNEFNCPDTTTVIYDLLFTNLFVPNAFAPGGEDESLRTFKPVGTNLKEYKIEVFSPWGNKVFSSKKLIDGAPAESWDGKFEGHEMSTGVYIWTISARFTDNSVWKGSDIGDGNTETRGTVTLIR